MIGREPDRLVIDDALRSSIRAAKVDEDRALREADLSRPLLVISLPEELFGPDAGELVIDGYHRLT